MARRPPLPEHGLPQGAEEGPVADSRLNEHDLSHDRHFAQLDVHNQAPRRWPLRWSMQTSPSADQAAAALADALRSVPPWPRLSRHAAETSVPAASVSASHLVRRRGPDLSPSPRWARRARPPARHREGLAGRTRSLAQRRAVLVQRQRVGGVRLRGVQEGGRVEPGRRRTWSMRYGPSHYRELVRSAVVLL